MQPKVLQRKPLSSTLDLFEPPGEDDEAYKVFQDVFARFQASASGTSGDGGDPDLGEEAGGKGEVIYSDDDQISESDEEDANKRAAAQKLSKRKQRQLRRLTVAELKQLVKKPELVEWEDVTAADPQLVIQLKSTRNTIPVPPHWNLKREYLQNKKGIEKPPFQLPPYIAATGIAEMKDALKEKEAEQTLKSKTRERVQPKMGKLTIDYRKLHDAFFRFQTKPESLTHYGEAYYEGKEYETKFKERRPGDLTDELKEALSIPPLAPPPWLIAMQRFGPPPSYPQLRIPGLSAPIPEGAQWGFHPGGWGRPPLDEYGNPLYGEVLAGQGNPEQDEAEIFGEEPEHEHYGELEPEEDAEDTEEESEEEEEEDEDDGEQQDGLQTPVDGLQTPSGLETPSGMQSVASSVPAGLETPGFLELRKGARGARSAQDVSQAPQAESGPRQLYHVLPEREVSGAQGFMASDHAYDVSQHMSAGGATNGAYPAAASNAPVLGAEASSRGTKRKTADGNGSGSVALALDPTELENMSEAQLAEVRTSKKMLRVEAAPSDFSRLTYLFLLPQPPSPSFQRYEQARNTSSGGPGAASDAEDLALLREELQRKRHAKEARRAAR